MKSNRFLLVVGICVLVAVTIYANRLLSTPKEEVYSASEIAYQEMNAPTQTPGYLQPVSADLIAVDNMGTDGANGAVDGDSFATFRSDRDNVREREIAYLDSMVTEATTDEETRKEAQKQKLELVAAMEKEVTIEGLLRAKGFDDVAVTVHKGSVNVIVAAASLDSNQVAQILDIAQRESGEPADNIKVVPKST